MRARIPVRLLLLAALVPAVAVLAATPGSFSGSRPDGVQASVPARVELDMDPTNGDGPCNPVDTTVQHNTGETYSIAVCLTNSPAAPASFELYLKYDDILNECLPATCPAEEGCLDANPDANAGATTFSVPDLGSTWTCAWEEPLVVPVCDADPEQGAGHGLAYLHCETGLPDSLGYGDGVSAPLAEVTFQAHAPGTDGLVIRAAVEDEFGGTLVECDYVGGECYGGTDVKVSEPVTPTATPMHTPTITSTPTATFTPVPPTATFTPIPPTPTPPHPSGVGGKVMLPPAAIAAESATAPEGSDWSNGASAALAGGIGAAFAALAVGEWYARRRWQGARSK